MSDIETPREETRPRSTRLDPKTLVIVLAFAGALVLLIALNMK
jgi:preprotein translocase subunit Sec61beta